LKRWTEGILNVDAEPEANNKEEKVAIIDLSHPYYPGHTGLPERGTLTVEQKLGLV